MKERIKETNILELWVPKHPEVKRWLSKISARAKNAFNLYRFCQWCNKQPAELLALKEDPRRKEAEKLLDNFVATEDTGFTHNVKFNIAIAVKSFFKHNYAQLESASGMIEFEKVKPTYKPRKEDLRKLWNWASNLRDKALITFVSSTAIAKGTLSQLKWKHLEENWENVELPCINIPSELLKGKGRGRYKGVKQITFLTREAKRDLLNYKEWIEQKTGRKLTHEDHVWLDIYAPYEPLKYERLGMLIWELRKSADIPFSWHDARRYVNTAMEEIRMPSNWARKIRGRKVKGEEAPYSQPAVEQLRTKFREAVPLLEFTSEKPRIGESDRRIITAIDNLRMSGLVPEERLKEMEREWLGKSPEIAIPKIGLEGQAWERVTAREGYTREEAFVIRKEVIEKEMEEIRKERIQPKTATNGGQVDCQRIVSEQELETYLNDGWHVAAVLPSGKVVVER